MKLLIALTFMYLLCRRRYAELPSAIGARAFDFCTFNNTWLPEKLAAPCITRIRCTYNPCMRTWATKPETYRMQSVPRKKFSLCRCIPS